MQLTIGQIVEGKITGITNFGVFVDLGEGKTGIVHISEAEPQSFEEMMNRFKQTSDEKFSDLKRKNPEARRTKRGAGK